MEPKKVETGPPALIEAVVRLLTPPACREHVLGDLWERYKSPRQYLKDAMRTVPFVIVSRIRRTSSAPLLAFQALIVFATFAGPPLMPIRTAVSATVAAVAILALRQAYRVDAPSWPKGLAMDALTVSLGAVLFSILSVVLFSRLSVIGTRVDIWLVSALDCGAGAFVLLFCTKVLWATDVAGCPPLRRRVVYLAACAAWATVIAVPVSMFAGFAAGVLMENHIIGGPGVTPENVLFAQAVVAVMSFAPTAAVIGAMSLCAARPRLAFGVLQKTASAR